ILGTPLPHHQPHRLHPVQQTGHIRTSAQQPAADFVAAEPVGPATAQDPQHVVLGQRQPVLEQQPLEAVLAPIGGRQQGQKGDLSVRGPRVSRNGGSGQVCHTRIIFVVTHNVKTPSHGPPTRPGTSAVGIFGPTVYYFPP